MYPIKKIQEKCYELNQALNKNNLIVKVFQNPTKIGYDIALFKSSDEPAIKAFFLDHTIAEAYFENGQCEAWKNLLR